MNLSSNVINKQKTIETHRTGSACSFRNWIIAPPCGHYGCVCVCVCVCVLESLLWCSCVRQTERVINYKHNGSCRSVSVCSDPFTYLTFASLRHFKCFVNVFMFSPETPKAKTQKFQVWEESAPPGGVLVTPRLQLFRAHFIWTHFHLHFQIFPESKNFKAQKTIFSSFFFFFFLQNHALINYLTCLQEMHLQQAFIEM